jgi:hypothetical protein
MCNPIWQTITATGKIKIFQIVDSLLVSGIILLTWVLLHWSPIGFPLTHTVINVIRVIFAVWMLSKLMEFSVWNFIKHSLSKNILVAMVACPIPIFVSFHFTEWKALFLTTTTFLLFFGLAVLFLGMNSGERLQIKIYALNFLHKLKVILRISAS